MSDLVLNSGSCCFNKTECGSEYDTTHDKTCKSYAVAKALCPLQGRAQCRNNKDAKLSSKPIHVFAYVQGHVYSCCAKVYYHKHTPKFSFILSSRDSNHTPVWVDTGSLNEWNTRAGFIRNKNIVYVIVVVVRVYDYQRYPPFYASVKYFNIYSFFSGYNVDLFRAGLLGV